MPKQQSEIQSTKIEKLDTGAQKSKKFPKP